LCTQREDVIKNPLLAGLKRIVDERLCVSFAERIAKMQLWQWKMPQQPETFGRD